MPIVDNIAKVIGSLEPQVGREDYVPIPIPLPGESAGTGVDWDKFLPRLRDYDPTKALPDTGTGVKEGEGEKEKEKEKEDEKTDTKTENPALPDDIAGLDVPDVTRKFPFCVPFDLIACLTVLNAKSETPRFTIPFVIPMINFQQDIVIDLSEFETLAAIIRWFETLAFIFGLAMITRNIIRG